MSKAKEVVGYWLGQFHMDIRDEKMTPERFVEIENSLIAALPLTRDESGLVKELAAFASTIARMTQDGEEVNGREFVMENDDAVTTLNDLISQARELVEAHAKAGAV